MPRYPFRVSEQVQGECKHQHRHRPTAIAVLIGVFAMIAVSAMAQTQADNTKVNTRDRNKGAVTADQQKEHAADRDLTRKIWFARPCSIVALIDFVNGMGESR